MASGGVGRLAICAVALWAAFASRAEAGAFTLAPGETKLFMTAVAISGDHYFDADGKLRRRESYRKDDLQLYAERGLVDGLTAFASSGLQRIVAKDGTTYERRGLGRTELGLRRRLFESGAWIGSIQGSGVVAGAKSRQGVAVIGETDDQLDGRFLVARSFQAFGKPGFVDLAAGYRLRGGDPADEWRFDATLGLRAAERWLLLAQSFVTIGVSRWSGPYALKQRIYKVQASALYDLTERWSLIGAAFATPVGRDALDERGATLGIGLRF